MTERQISPAPAADEFGIWFLRVDDNQIRGPVSLATLRQWAEAGQLAAEDEISPDAKSWQPAATVASLEFEWLADLESGETYGPFNIKAVRQLVERGILRPDSVLRRRTPAPRTQHPGALPTRSRPATPITEITAGSAADERVLQVERELRTLRTQLSDLQQTPAGTSHRPGSRALTDTEDSGNATMDRLFDKVQHTEELLQRLVQNDHEERPQHAAHDRLPLAPPHANAPENWLARRPPLPVRRHAMAHVDDDDMDWDHPADPRELARTRRFRAQTLRWNIVNSSLVIGSGVTVGAVGVMLGVEPVQYTGVVLSFLGILYFGLAMLLLLTRKLSNWAHLSVVKESAATEEGHPLRGAMNISIYWFNRKFRSPPRQ